MYLGVNVSLMGVSRLGGFYVILRTAQSTTFTQYHTLNKYNKAIMALRIDDRWLWLGLGRISDPIFVLYYPHRI